MSDFSEPKPEVLFFLGAGASVAANVPDTYEMVDVFKKKIFSQEANSAALAKILKIKKEEVGCSFS